MIARWRAWPRPGCRSLYLNQVGGQDELVFDGASFVLNADGAVAVQMPAWEEAVGITEWRRDGGALALPAGRVAEIEQGDAANYLACVTGLRDYVDKNGFPGVVLGLSGGIDSALCAAHGGRCAWGRTRARRHAALHYTSNESLSDAAETAQALGVRYDIMPIHATVEGLTKDLEQAFTGRYADTTEENLQSRARGTLLMASPTNSGRW